jgi:hypothetical protein
MPPSQSMKDPVKQQTMKEPKLVQMDKVLCKWLTAMCSEGNNVTGPIIAEKGKIFLR